MGREHEIAMIPVTAIVREGNAAAAVHGDLPRADPLIKNARDQRTGDLAARIAPLTQPDSQQVNHVIAGLRNRREGPVPEYRADVRVQDGPVCGLGRVGASVPTNPLLALVPEPGS